MRFQKIRQFPQTRNVFIFVCHRDSLRRWCEHTPRALLCQAPCNASWDLVVIVSMKKRTSSNGKKRTTVFNVRLETEMLDALRVLAEHERRTVTNMVQLLIAEELVRRGIGLQA